MITYLSGTGIEEAMRLDPRVRGAVAKRLLAYHEMVNGVPDDEDELDGDDDA